MRYLMFIMVFILLPNVFFAQQTYVPDDNFELRLIELGYDESPLNDSVPTKNIETVISLNVRNRGISDLTGIEDFATLERLDCLFNLLTSIDLSNNSALKMLYCDENDLTSLDLSNNPALETLLCYRNKLSSIDLSNNSALKDLSCGGNNLTSLDLSNNPALEILACGGNDLKSINLRNNSALEILTCFENDLTSLNIKNGNNKNMTGNDGNVYFDASDNPNLECIQVDDSAWSANAEKWRKDDHAHYSEDCGYTGVEEFLTEGTEISIFPNPAGKNFTVSFELETPKTIHLALTDLSGSELQEFTLEHKQYVNEEIDVSMLSSGVYFLRIEFGSESISRKIVVE